MMKSLGAGGGGGGRRRGTFPTLPVEPEFFFFKMVVSLLTKQSSDQNIEELCSLGQRTAARPWGVRDSLIPRELFERERERERERENYFFDVGAGGGGGGEEEGGGVNREGELYKGESLKERQYLWWFFSVQGATFST